MTEAVRSAHVYRDGSGEARVAIRYTDDTETDRPATQLEALLARSESAATDDAKAAACWRALKEMAGYYQDGSNVTVELYQDDANRSFHIEVNGKSYGTDARSFEAAIAEYQQKEQAHDRR